MKVLILKDFAEDKRISMDTYAEQLQQSLQNHAVLRVKSYTPKISGFASFFPLSQANKMRFSRFVSYPRQVASLKSDIYHIVDHGYSHLLRVLPAQKAIVTVHDLIPLLLYKEQIPGMQKSIRPYLVEYSLGFLKKAGLIIAVSENTRKDIIKYLDCGEDQVRVVHNGLDSGLYCETSSEKKQALRQSFGLPLEKKIIMFSGSEFYKNHHTVISTAVALRDRGLNIALLKLGRATVEWLTSVKQAGFEQAYYSFQGLSRQKIADLYNCADCLFFPSVYEGFGWPPLEAMACGVPAVVSNLASLPEVVGEAGLMSDPFDVKAFVQQIESVIKNDEFRSSMIQKGLERAAIFSWANTADKLAMIYSEVWQKAQKRK